jgi:tRNA(fMet)-specific endonuclease VapC
VKPSLIDTDILSMFFRGNALVIARFDEYLRQHAKINFSIVTYYEILSGLKHCDARQQLTSFQDFAAQNIVLPLTLESVTLSAETYAELRRQGQPLDDMDLLIAGIALANDLVLVTHNTNHFARIEPLTVEDWSEPSA